MINFKIYQALFVSWMVLIFVLSSQPSLAVPSSIPQADKLIHALAYGVLGYFFSRSFAPFEVISIKRILLVTTLVTVCGITDEFHQLFVPGRVASIWDVLADCAGGMIVALIMYWRYHHSHSVALS